MAVRAGTVMLADRGTHAVNATSVACAGWNRLPDVEAAMLVEVQKVNKAYKDLQSLLLNQIQQEYQKPPKGRAAK
jgi:hypothetical protein